MKIWKNRIQALKEAHGGIERLAVELGVSYATVYRWLVGKSEPVRHLHDRIEELEKTKGRVTS